jgi:sec-independent protein translocase protein TatA
MGIGAFQPMHLLLILLIVLVVFGAGKLSQVGGALGQSVREFKASVDEEPGIPSADQAEGEGGPVLPALPSEPEARPTAGSPVAELLRREEI